MRLIHGWSAASQFAGSDFWGTHRYRDWNVLLVGSGGFEQFAAPANDPNFADWSEVQDLYVQNPEIGRIIEVEWDSGFFAPEMAPQLGDETRSEERRVGKECRYRGSRYDEMQRR